MLLVGKAVVPCFAVSESSSGSNEKIYYAAGAWSGPRLLNISVPLGRKEMKAPLLSFIKWEH